MRIFLTFLFITTLSFVSNSQKILSSYPRQIERKVNSTITIKCFDVDFTKNNYDFSFSNNSGSDFIVILNIQHLCKDVVKLTVNSSDYFYNSSYDLTIRDKNSNKSYTLNNALLVSSKGEPELVSIDKKRVKKGSKLTVKYSGLRTHFKSGQASETVVSLNNQGSQTIRLVAKSIYVNSETDLDATFEIPTNIESGVYFPMVENYIDNSIGLFNYSDALYIEDEQNVEIISVKKLSSASNTVKLLVSFNQYFDLKSVSNSTVGVDFNNNFITASTTIVNSNQLQCEIQIPNYVYNGSYPLYFFYNNYEYAVFDNAIIINSNPHPSIINFPIKVNAGKNNNITLYGSNTNFDQASSTLYIDFNQGSSTIVEIKKSQNGLTLNFDLYVPKNTPSGFYSTSLYRKEWYFNELIGEFKNSIEVVNETPPSFLINDNNTFTTNNSISFKVDKSGEIDVFKDIKEIFVYFETGIKTPVYVTNVNNETLTLSCYIKPNINSGNYSVYFESLKDGVFISKNNLRVKGNNPFIYEIKPAIVTPGNFYDFTIKMDNIVLNEENVKGLLLEFQNQCITQNSILSYNTESILARIFIDNNVLEGDYKVLLTNTNYQIASQEILKVSRLAQISNNLHDSALKIYPNPCISGNFNIFLDENPYTGEFQIVDLQGKEVYHHALGNTDKPSDIKPGIYIVSIQTNNRIYNEKIIVE